MSGAESSDFWVKKEGSTVLSASSYDAYKVRTGDTISEIAAKFRVTKKALMSINGINNPRLLRAGQVLKIPEMEAGAPRRSPVVATSYIVRRGDSLYKISRRFSVSLSRLCDINGLSKKAIIYPGQKLKVPGSSSKIDSASKPKVYAVRSGDSLFKISKKLGTTVARLRQLNPSARGIIYPGQKLFY